MGVRIANLLELDVMEKARVLAGVDQIDHKRVEWVSIIEVPVENFVRKHELVLSTAMKCDDLNIFKNFIEDVIRSGASGLAIATGRYVTQIPEEIIKLAEENELILIELDWEIPFSEIVQSAVHLINHRQDQLRQKTEELRIKLMDTVLNSESLESLMEVLYEAIKIPVVISDAKKKVRANYAFDTEVIDAINEFNHLPVTVVDPPEVPFGDHPLYQHMNQYLVNDKSCYELTIFSNHKKQGYLLFMPEEPDELDDYVMYALEHGLTACALYFLTENAVEMTEIRLKDNFVMQLAKESKRIDAKMLSKGELLGYDLSLRYVCIVGDYLTEQSTDVTWETEQDQPHHSSLHSLNYYIQKEIIYASRQMNRVAMSTFEEGEVIIYLEVDDVHYQKSVHHFLDIIERRLANQLTEVRFSWGIGMHQQGFQTFYESYREARTALDIHVKKGLFIDRTFFEDTKLNRMLMTILDTVSLESIVKDTIGPIIDYDQKKHSDLIHTFMTYQQFKGNVSQTARALHLHRQSLLYRLKKVEELTGLTLIEADDTFLLEMCIRLWQMKQLDWQEPVEPEE